MGRNSEEEQEDVLDNGYECEVDDLKENWVELGSEDWPAVIFVEAIMISISVLLHQQLYKIDLQTEQSSAECVVAQPEHPNGLHRQLAIIQHNRVMLKNVRSTPTL